MNCACDARPSLAARAAHGRPPDAPGGRSDARRSAALLLQCAEDVLAVVAAAREQGAALGFRYAAEAAAAALPGGARGAAGAAAGAAAGVAAGAPQAAAEPLPGSVFTPLTADVAEMVARLAHAERGSLGAAPGESAAGAAPCSSPPPAAGPPPGGATGGSAAAAPAPPAPDAAAAAAALGRGEGGCIGQTAPGETLAPGVDAGAAPEQAPAAGASPLAGPAATPAAAPVVEPAAVPSPAPATTPAIAPAAPLAVAPVRAGRGSTLAGMFGGRAAHALRPGPVPGACGGSVRGAAPPDASGAARLAAPAAVAPTVRQCPSFSALLVSGRAVPFCLTLTTVGSLRVGVLC